MNGLNDGGRDRLRIGIYGGTFDPPHLGHLILAAESRYQLRLDRLLWVLTPQPPHKPGQPITPVEDRLALVEAAIADAPDFELSRVDIDRPAPHYALDTVQELRRFYPDAVLAYLMGGDSLRDLPAWHAPLDLVEAVDVLGVMRRPEAPIDLEALAVELPGVLETVYFVDAPLLDIASRDVRTRIRSGAPYRYYVHPGVYERIENRRLYRK